VRFVTDLPLVVMLKAKDTKIAAARVPRIYLPDPDLAFLARVENDELEPLVLYLIGSHEQPRLTESLTLQQEYKRNGKNYQGYLDAIIHELQLFGGNTFANLARGGQGVSYRTILKTVCKKVGAKVSTEMTVERMEALLIDRVAEKALRKMSAEQIQALVASLSAITVKKQQLTAAAKLAIDSVRLTPYRLSAIVAYAMAKRFLGRGLPLLSNVFVTRAISVFAGPLGVVMNILWAGNMIAGPAYRVIIPSCCHIAYLRLKYEQ
jgi:uncharacterized protein YaaW (UPF0174 family)